MINIIFNEEYKNTQLWGIYISYGNGDYIEDQFFHKFLTSQGQFDANMYNLNLY